MQMRPFVYMVFSEWLLKDLVIRQSESYKVHASKIPIKHMITVIIRNQIKKKNRTKINK